jgi:hypothetical protein
MFCSSRILDILNASFSIRQDIQSWQDIDWIATLKEGTEASTRVVDAIKPLQAKLPGSGFITGPGSQREIYLLGMNWILWNACRQRVWILEEVLFAREITLRCGDLHLVTSRSK